MNGADLARNGTLSTRSPRRSPSPSCAVADRSQAVGASSFVLCQLLWPSRALWSEKEKTNLVASKMPIPIGVDMDVR
jgi:hypothetical protein